MTTVAKAVWNSLTWRKIVIWELLGQLAIFVESCEGDLFGTWMGHTSEHYVSMSLNVLLVMATALWADAAVNQGARAKLAYPLAIFATYPWALLCTYVVQSIYVELFPLRPGTRDVFWRSIIETSFHLYIYGAFAMLVYFNQRTADRLLERFRTAEHRRVQLERELIESRIATAEAQIDPKTLIDSLAAIKQSLAAGRDEGETQLGALIQSLRAALARSAAANDPSGAASA